MSIAEPLTITGGRLVLAEGEPQPGAIRCENGVIVALGRDAVARDGDTIVDARGALIAPALVDMGVFAIDRPAFHFGGIVRAALMPDGVEAMGVAPFYDFDAALDGAEVVMMLRLQQERMSGEFIPSPREYRHLYGLTLDRLSRAAPGALVMHPGPMNRGVEIDSNVADLAGKDGSARSLITRQVENGVAIRMACLDVLTRPRRKIEGWG